VHHGAGYPVQECARYLETFKSFETKPADAIQACLQLSMHTHHLCHVHSIDASDEHGCPPLTAEQMCRPPQGRVEEDYVSRLHVAMTTVRGVNKTNVLTLGRAFKSVAGIMQVLLHLA
jgi:hypothetical protein